MTFQNLIPNPQILSTLEEIGYLVPTPIQQQAIPVVLENKDIQASASTGTGKTAAFLLPALVRLTSQAAAPGRGPRVLILVPTRELAMQVATEARKFSKNLQKMKTVCVYGGTSYHEQNRDLARPYEILIATPGRLMDHMNRGKVDLSRIEMLILDEADRMLDLGFVDDVEQIADATPKTRQTLLFSATLKSSVCHLSKRLLNNPVEIKVAAEQREHTNIEQYLHNVDNLDHKYQLLDQLLDDPVLHQVIVFTSTKRQADLLSDKLMDNGQLAAVLHGDLRQRQRTQTVSQFRQGKFRVLVATDVAARGIDIPAVTHVINFDLPMNVEDYVHRIGRTGRAGAKGTALSFVTRRDLQLLKRIERFTGKSMRLTPGQSSSQPRFTVKTSEERPRQSFPSQPRFTTEKRQDKQLRKSPFSSKFGGKKNGATKPFSKEGKKRFGAKSRAPWN